MTYAEYEAAANRVAHLYRAQGLQRMDHVAFLMENNPRMLEAEGGAERTGLYYTCINSYLAADEVAYIVNDSQARVVVTSAAKREVARSLPAQCPNVERWLMVDVPDGADCRRLRAVRRRGRRVPDRRPSPTSNSARRCSTRRARPASPRASCGRCRRRTSRPAAGHGVREVHVPLPRGDDLPVAGAALPLGAAGERVGHGAPRRHGGDHGALRPRAVPRARRPSTGSRTARWCRRCSRAC